MQSTLLNFHAQSRLSANQMRIKIGIAAPTATGKSHMICIPVTKPLSNTWKFCSRYNGFYDANSLNVEKCTSLKLLKFLQIAKNHYQLKDVEALELLAFFKNQITEAIFHLNKAGNGPKMKLDIDRRWRLETKTISELTRANPFATLKILRNTAYITNPMTYLNILPTEAMIEAYGGRDIRIQRTYCNNTFLQVACVMDTIYDPFEVTSVMMELTDNWNISTCVSLLSNSDSHLVPLILSIRPGD